MSTIFVIDDDAAVLQAYGRLLRRNGHEVVLIRDVGEVQQAPEILRRADLLILDQRMPRITGLELLRSLRRGAYRSADDGPAVLLVSAFLNEDLRRSAAALGVVGVIEKPVHPGDLLRTVETSLARRNPAGRVPTDDVA